MTEPAVQAFQPPKLAVGELPSEETSILYRGRASVAGLPLAPVRFQLG